MDTKTICLAVLARGDATGYEIKKAFEDGPFCHIQDIGFGSIYPALNKLLDERLVTVTERADGGRPARKVYRIAPAGRMALIDGLATTATPADKVRSDFLFKMLYAHLMSAKEVDAIIDERLRHLRESIARMEQCAAHVAQGPSEAFVNGFGLAIYRTMAAYVEENRVALVGASLMTDKAVAE